MPNAQGITLAGDRNPWERQPRETDKQYVAFQTFLNVEPPRSIAKCAEALGRTSLGHLYDWSSRNHWMDRAIHYDGYLQRSQDEALVLQRKEMNERHAKLAKAMSLKVAARIGDLKPEELTPGELGRWMQVISMVERLALGEGPQTPVVDVQVNVDASKTDITLDATHIGEVMDRLHALNIVPAPSPLPDTTYTVGDASLVTPEGVTSSPEEPDEAPPTTWYAPDSEG